MGAEAELRNGGKVASTRDSARVRGGSGSDADVNMTQHLQKIGSGDTGPAGSPFAER